jgi:hypothetical protein
MEARTMITKFILAAVAMVFSLVVVAAEPETTEEAIAQNFEKLDTNQDGAISQSEAQSRKDLVDNWAKVDKNQNGKLEFSEFSAYEPAIEYVPPLEEGEEGIGAAPR